MIFNAYAYLHFFPIVSAHGVNIIKYWWKFQFDKNRTDGFMVALEDDVLSDAVYAVSV